MRWTWACNVAALTIFLSPVHSFSCASKSKLLKHDPRLNHAGRNDGTTILFEKTNRDEKSVAESNNEDFFEDKCQSGAFKISTMDISERTKRAMLAEMIEDNIVSFEDKLEKIIGDEGIIAEDEKLRNYCVDIARQIKKLQGQYESLVSGAPSDLLNSIDSVGPGSS